MTDVFVLFVTRTLRLFSYGFLAVVLVLYLTALGLSGFQIGLLLALTLLGDAAISLWLTTHADRLGRRRVLVIGALLVLAAGLVFVATPVYVVLLVAATIGVISPAGNEVGPFLAVEQASLSQLVPGRQRTSIFARYQLVGAFATAAGTLAGGVAAQLAINAGFAPVDAYRLVIGGYAVGGLLLALLFLLVSPAVEVPRGDVVDDGIRRRLGLHQSQSIVLRLSALFALDAFAGGFVVPILHCVLVQRAMARRPSVLGASCSRRERAGWHFGPGSGAACRAVRADPDDGLHPPAIQRPAHPGAVHADGWPGRGGPARALLDQPDGRANAPVLHDGRRRAGRTLGSRGRDGYRAQPRRLGIPIAGRPAVLVRHARRLPFVISGGLKVVYDLLLYRSFSALRESDE